MCQPAIPVVISQLQPSESTINSILMSVYLCNLVGRDLIKTVLDLL